MRTRTAVALPLAALLALSAAGQAPEVTYKSTELAPGLYMLEGVGGFAGGNLGLMVGEDEVVLIDDGLPPLIDKVRAAVAELTDEEIDYLVNTHVHGDHIGGNEALGEAGTTIFAHHNLRRRLVEQGISTPSGFVPAPEEALPVVTFADSVTFHLDDREAFVFHVADAHTDGDAAIHFRDDNVIHAGDLFFNGLFPFVDLDTGGSVEGYLAGQRRLLELSDADTRIIPGHGPLAGRAELQAAVDMLADSLERVRALVDAGRSEEEILAENPLADYHDDWNWGFITTERMTRTLYRSLTAE
ncbi:MAG: MBL fold metallo-hydrolase [Thermoanaerobaculia bacterium]|nr:MBL fold metallo-hydrolase [Thermoanaerobaculia bacterium]